MQVFSCRITSQAAVDRMVESGEIPNYPGVRWVFTPAAQAGPGPRLDHARSVIVK